MKAADQHAQDAGDLDLHQHDLEVGEGAVASVVDDRRSVGIGHVRSRSERQAEAFGDVMGEEQGDGDQRHQVEKHRPAASTDGEDGDEEDQQEDAGVAIIVYLLRKADAIFDQGDGSTGGIGQEIAAARARSSSTSSIVVCPSEQTPSTAASSRRARSLYRSR